MTAYSLVYQSQLWSRSVHCSYPVSLPLHCSSCPLTASKMQVTVASSLWHLAQLCVDDQKVIRSHLLSCLVDGEMNPFPCKKMTRRCKTKKTCIIAIHCTCRTQETGNMVEHEQCEWFHQDCAKVPHHI